MRTWWITAPERIKLAWRALREWIAGALLRLVDRYLAERGEERTNVPVEFYEIPVLYQEKDFVELAIEEVWNEW